MSLQISDNFSYLGAKPLDGRLVFDSLNNMGSFPESCLYDGCLAYNKEDSTYYFYDSNNDADNISGIGKWGKFQGEPQDTSFENCIVKEYAENTAYKQNQLVFLDRVLCRVVNNYTSSNSGDAKVSMDADILTGNLFELNDQARHKVHEYKQNTLYYKDDVLVNGIKVFIAQQDFLSDNSASTIEESILSDIVNKKIIEAGDYKFKLYKTSKDLSKVVDDINEIPFSTLTFVEGENENFLQLNEGIYGPLGTLSIIIDIDYNTKIAKTKTVTSREVDFMPPAPIEYNLSVVNAGSGYIVGDIVSTNLNKVNGLITELDEYGGIANLEYTDQAVTTTLGAGASVTAIPKYFVGNGKIWYDFPKNDTISKVTTYEQGTNYTKGQMLAFEDNIGYATVDFISDITCTTVEESFLLDIQNAKIEISSIETPSVPECLGSIEDEDSFPANDNLVKGNWVIIRDCNKTEPGNAGIGLYNGTSWIVTVLPKGEVTFPEPTDDSKQYFRVLDTGSTTGRWEAFTNVNGNDITINIKSTNDNTYVPQSNELVWDKTREILVLGDGATALSLLEPWYLTEVGSNEIISAIGYEPENKDEKGAAGGYAPLGVDSKVPIGFLPDNLVDTYSKTEIDTKVSTINTNLLTSINTEIARAQAKESDIETNLQAHIDNASLHVTQSEKDGWNAKVDTSALDPFNNHIIDTSIHVTQDDKDRWNGAQKAHYVTSISDLPLTGNQIGNIGYVQVSAANVTPVVCEQYIWDGTAWKQLDVNQVSLQLKWGNIEDKPLATPLTIDNAVGVAHAHTNKTILDKIGQTTSGNFTFDNIEIGIKARFYENDNYLPTVGEPDTLYVVYSDARTRQFPSISVYHDNAYQILGKGAQEQAPAVGDMNILQAEYYSVVANSTYQIQVSPNQFFAFMPLEILKEIEGLKNQQKTLIEAKNPTDFDYDENIFTMYTDNKYIQIDIKPISAILDTVSNEYYYHVDVDLSNYREITGIN